MVQGTGEEAVWNICQNGFATVAKTDDGYYGKGIFNFFFFFFLLSTCHFQNNGHKTISCD
jgi:hypothetical protein